MPAPGDLVRIHYVGKLENGTVFDSSRARGSPFEFNLGESEVIDGWDLLVGTMPLGERADLVIPPDYAYGEEGIPPVVPPNATLYFDVEVLDIGRPVEEEGTVAGSTSQEDDDEEEGDGELAPGELFWEKDPEIEGGVGQGFKWKATGTGREICITVPLSKDTKLKDIDVDVRTFTLKCKIGGKVLIDGEVWADVDMDDSHWDFERKGEDVFLLIYLSKLNRQQKWESLLKGGEAPVAEAAAVESPEVEVLDADEAREAAMEGVRRRAEAQLK